MNCTRCQGTGFINLHQVDEEVLELFDARGDHSVILDWMDIRSILISTSECLCHISPPCPRCELHHDVSVCDCCGNGEDWYGEPGQHNNFRGPQAREPFPECY